MKFKQTINSFSAWTVDRLTSARRATLTMFATFLIAMTAQTAWAESVTYIDADGTEKSHDATVIDGSQTSLTGGWYVVNSDVSLTSLTFTGDAYLILADDKTLTISGTSVNTTAGTVGYGLLCMTGTFGNSPTYHDLTIYGQSGGTGTISAKHGTVSGNLGYDYRANNITINGGIIETTGTQYGVWAVGNLTINGGQVISTATIYGNHVTLGWRNLTDYIQAKVIDCGNEGSIQIATGKVITDGTNIYDGTNTYNGTNIYNNTTTTAKLKGQNVTLRPCLVLSANADNAAAIAEYSGKKIAVALYGRTLKRDNKWNTLCLPFDVTIADSPLKYCSEAKMFTTSSLSATGELTLKFSAAPATISAGTPFIIKWDSAVNPNDQNQYLTIDNPVFVGVTISNTAAKEVTSSDGKVKFVGQYSPFGINNENIKQIYYFGADEIIGSTVGNNFGYASAAKTLLSFDTHFVVPTTSAGERAVTAFAMTTIDEWSGDGSADTPYIISNTDQLDMLAQRVNAGNDAVVNGFNGKFFKLGANIAYNKETANNFTPIGNNNMYFYGTFDGQGYTISGININRSGLDAEHQGVFGFLYGTVENLVVSNCSIVGSSNVGAIAGYLATGTIKNCSASDNVTLSGNGYVGGIVGASSNGTIKGCVSAATITGIKISGCNADDLGGIAGATTPSQDPSVLTNNLFTGTISDNLNEYIGAIVGQNYNGTLTNNLYTSTGFGGIGAKETTEDPAPTGVDADGAHKAVVISAAEGVTITPTGTKTTYNVSGITAYTDNNFIGYDSKLYAGATTSATFSIDYTKPEGYMFEGFDAGEGVGIVLNEGVYNLAVPASGNVTISPKLKNLTMTLAEIEEFETLAIDENMQSYVENGALKLSVTPKNKFWTLACGVDLLLPEGIVVYKARMNSAGTKVDLTEISDSELNGVLKANNGVLIASTPGESYEFKVSPDNSVTTLSTADAKSYGNDNQLVPVLEETHFDSENYFILTDNQFVMVDVSQDTKVPAGKAVLKVPAGTAQARAFGIDGYDMTGDTTGINAALENAGEEVWYNLQGQRISKPTRKGIYILNGKKVRM